ncbi:MAG: glycosyltransferase family 2 protein [Salinivirgaceae bacterium]|nr:glycosyltransferase family 2 protein [Salinivirgaceae bacterium]
MKISIVVSIYNEQDSLTAFWEELKSIICNSSDIEYQIIWINDGSKDNSQKIINDIVLNDKKENYYFTTIEFSRNFGHEAAMIAGIDHSEGDAAICMDADLQHPPSQIPLMLKEFVHESEIVLMERIKRHDNGIFKNLMSKIFYVIFNKLTDGAFKKNSSDFFLISKRVIKLLQNNYREKNRFIRGYIQIIGFNKTTLSFEAPSRFAGETNYNFKSLFKLAINAFFVFSNKLLSISFYISLLFSLLSSIVIIYSIYQYFFGSKVPSGYTTLIIFNSMCFTILFFLIAILSFYFGKTADEIKNRPIYLIKNLSTTKLQKE